MVRLATAFCLVSTIAAPAWAQAGPRGAPPDLVVRDLVGAAVWTSDRNRVRLVRVGPGPRAALAVLRVGGVLGFGAREVALPLPELRHDATELSLPHLTEADLRAMLPWRGGPRALPLDEVLGSGVAAQAGLQETERP